MEFTGAPIEYTGTFPRVITEDLLEAADPISREFMEYYCTKRGRHIHSTGQITINSTVALMSFYPFANMDLLAGQGRSSSSAVIYRILANLVRIASNKRKSPKSSI